MTNLKNTIKELQAMDWKEFADLDEVQVETGNQMFYNNGTVQVCIDFEGYDYEGADNDIWEDKEIFTELKELAIEALEEELEWETL